MCCPTHTCLTQNRSHTSARGQANPEALRLFENFRGVQSSLSVLHHPKPARRSREPPDWRCNARAEQLARSGVKELLVISQDTSAYGVDIKYKTDFWGGRPLRSDLYNLASALGELGIWVGCTTSIPILMLIRSFRLWPGSPALPRHPVATWKPSVLKRMKRPAASEKH